MPVSHVGMLEISLFSWWPAWSLSCLLQTHHGSWSHETTPFQVAKKRNARQIDGRLDQRELMIGPNLQCLREGSCEFESCSFDVFLMVVASSLLLICPNRTRYANGICELAGVLLGQLSFSMSHRVSGKLPKSLPLSSVREVGKDTLERQNSYLPRSSMADLCAGWR